MCLRREGLEARKVAGEQGVGLPVDRNNRLECLFRGEWDLQSLEERQFRKLQQFGWTVAEVEERIS